MERGVADRAHDLIRGHCDGNLNNGDQTKTVSVSTPPPLPKKTDLLVALKKKKISISLAISVSGNFWNIYNRKGKNNLFLYRFDARIQLLFCVTPGWYWSVNKISKWCIEDFDWDFEFKFENARLNFAFDSWFKSII